MSIEEWRKDFKGVNYDFIQALILKDGRLQIKTYPISHDNKLINDLFKLYNDDSATIVDLVYSFRRHIVNTGDYMYCLCHSYYDSYISKNPYNIPSVVYPDLNEYIKQWNEYFSKEENNVRRVVLNQHPELTRFEANEEIAKRLKSKTQKENSRFKEAFLRKSIPYIFSVDYDRVKKDIVDSGEVLCLTNEDYCRTTYSHTITEDLKITLVYPVIKAAIPPMTEEVKTIELSIGKLEKRLKPIKNKFDRLNSILDARLQKRIEKNLSYDDIKTTFDNRYPEYEKLKSIISEIEGDINNQRIQLSQRKKFLDKMTEAKGLIEKYVDIQ